MRDKKTVGLADTDGFTVTIKLWLNLGGILYENHPLEVARAVIGERNET